MKTSILFKWAVTLLSFSFLTACIETEIVPESLEPILELTPKNAVLSVNEVTQMQAIYTDPANIDRSDLIVWQSANPAVAEVSSSGLVRALTAGQTWIVARVPGVLADSTLVTVISNTNAVASVMVNIPLNTLEAGATLQCTATVRDGNGDEIPEQMVTWQSSNPMILQIDENGLATGISPGMANIIATADGVSSVPVAVEVTPVGGASRTGNFQGSNSYNVRGTATLATENGSLQLRFGDDFQSSNGPGLRVYLATNAPAVLTSQNSVRLGNLKSTRGAQTYDVPASVAIDDFDFVVIYCEPFNVPFGFARLD